MRRPAALLACACVLAVYAGTACAKFEAETLPVGDAGSDAQAPDAAIVIDASADAADAGCSYPSCAGAVTCVSEQFQSGCGAFALNGDSDAMVTKTCTGGKVTLKADGTYDARAEATYVLPTAPYTSVRVGTRVVINDWDGEALLAYAIGVNELATIKAEYNDSFKQLTLRLCRAGACDDSNRYIGPLDKQPRAIVIIATKDDVKLEVDCKPAGSLKGIELATKVPLGVRFGHNDANPIDGTLDDVLVDVR